MRRKLLKLTIIVIGICLIFKVLWLLFCLSLEMNSDDTKMPIYHIELVIDNQTDEMIDNFVLVTSGQSVHHYPVFKIDKKEEKKIVFDVPIDYGPEAAAIVLKYNDYNGEYHNVVLDGYINTGPFEFNLKVINRSDEGVYNIEIEREM